MEAIAPTILISSDIFLLAPMHISFPFFPFVILLWNDLPNSAVNAESVTAFQLSECFANHSTILQRNVNIYMLEII